MDFATYIVERAAATRGEVLLAIEQQQKSRPAIGRLAMMLGTLDSAQVFTILAHQTRHGAERFGEAAVALGLLTQPHVDDLLREQRRRTAPLEDFLVKADVMDVATARQLRETYERVYGGPVSVSGVRLAVPRASRRSA